jgi:hypothetical protein
MTDIKTEIDRLLDLRKQIEETLKQIENLGYTIWRNSPEDTHYSMRARVFNKLKLKIVSRTPHPLLPGSPPIEEWLVAKVDRDHIDDMLWKEYEKERYTP